MSVPTKLLVMADYFADPIWVRTADGQVSVCVDLDGLPLSDDLKTKLRAWAARFDALQHSSYEWPDAPTRIAWEADGARLTDAVRDELGPGFDVEYFHGQA